MTDQDMDKLVNECLKNNLTKNFDLTKQILISDIEKGKEKSEWIPRIIMRAVELGAKYGIYSTIEVLNKLHVIDIDKLQKPD